MKQMLHDAQRVVIGSLLLDNATFERIRDRVRPWHFHDLTHRAVFVEIECQIGAGQSCDVITVWEELRSKPCVWVTLAELNAIAQCAPSPDNAARYAAILIDRAHRHALSPQPPSGEWVSAHDAMVMHLCVLEARMEGE